MRTRLPRRLRRILLLGVGLLVLLALVVQGWFFVHILWWKWNDPHQTAFMQANLERLRAKNPRARLVQTWVAYEGISVNLKRAVIAAEDANFVDHEGFDWEAIQHAMARNMSKGKVVAGASTISQQLAKNLFLSGTRSFTRKVEEAAITWMIETTLSKRRILEIYLNVAEWGNGIFGVEAAAQYHFGVSAADLDTGQAAWLAAVLPMPRRIERGRTTPFLEGRLDTIRAGMPFAQIP